MSTLAFMYTGKEVEVLKVDISKELGKDIQIDHIFNVALKKGKTLGAMVSDDEAVSLHWDMYSNKLEESLNKMMQGDKEDKTLAEMTDKALRECANTVFEMKKDGNIEGAYIPASVERAYQLQQTINNTMNNMEEELTMNKETVITEVEVVEVEEAVKELTSGIGKEELKAIFLGDEKEAYKKLILAKDNSFDRMVRLGVDSKVISSITNKSNDMKAKINAFLEKHSNAEKAYRVLVVVIKKVIAIMLGITTFVAESALILASMVVRVAIHVAEEGTEAGKAIGTSFNKNIIGLFRKNK